jgi:hypothetical protein
LWTSHKDKEYKGGGDNDWIAGDERVIVILTKPLMGRRPLDSCKLEADASFYAQISDYAGPGI